MAQARAITVAAMPLSKALDAIGSQSGTRISYDPDAVPGLISTPVRDAKNAIDAVRTAIRGTGLAVTVAKDGNITVGNDIVVTATRDEAETSFRVAGAQSSNRSGKSLKELPQGTEVLSSALFSQQQDLTINDALRNSAGVSNSLGNVQGAPSFRVRGQTASAIQNGVTSGVNTVSIDTVERIEVLKGPSAILAGADNLGGTINIVDKRPSADPILDVSAQYGSFNDKKIVVDASDALNDSKTLSARIIGVEAGSTSSYGGYEGRREQTLAPSIRYKTATSDIIIGLNTSDGRGPLSKFRVLDTATPSSFLDTPGRIGPRNQAFTDKVTRYYLSAEQVVTQWLTLVARATHTDDHLTASIYSPVGFIDPSSPNEFFAFAESINNKQATNAVDGYARIKFKTGPLKHIITTGYNYSNFRVTSYQQADDVNSFVSFDINSDLSMLPTPAPADVPSYRLTTKQNGYYIQDFVDIGRLHVLAAARRNKYDSGIVLFPNGGSRPPHQKTAETTPSFGAVFDVTRQISIYGNYSRGFSPSFATDCSGKTLPNVETENIEGGAKADFFRKKLSMTVSLYQLKQSNTSVPDFSCPIGGRYSAQGGTETRGVELTANGRLFDGMDISASYSYADNTYQTPSAENGTVPPLVYKNKYSLYASYSAERGRFRGLGIAGGIFGTGRTYVDSFGQNYIRPQVEFDANLTYRLDKFTLNLGVKNLTGRKLYAVASNPAYIPYEQPRTVTATLTYRFFK